MRKAILTLILTITALLSACAKNDQVTVIISLDGFRWDYTQWYDTPFLDRMAQEAGGTLRSSTVPQARNSR